MRNVQGQGTSEGLCWLVYRGNHERWRRSQRFYPTSWGFHPSEGFTAQLFNRGVRPSVRRTPGAERTNARRDDVYARRHRRALTPRSGYGSPFRSSAAPCQLPPPHPPPPPPQDDPPPQDELPPQEELEPHDELLPESPALLEPAAPPAHQLSLPPAPPPAAGSAPPGPAAGSPGKPGPPRLTTITATNTAHQDDKGDDGYGHDAHPPFVPPRRPPVGTSPSCVTGGCPPVSRCQSRVEEVQSFGAG